MNPTPASRASRIASSSPRPWLATSTAVRPATLWASAPASIAKPSGPPSCDERIGDRSRADDHHRAAGSFGSRNTSMAPPERHGLIGRDRSRRVRETPRCRRAGCAATWIRPVSSTSSAVTRTDSSAHCPPMNPSMVPSGSTIAASPGRAEVGHWARTTVAWTNRRRSSRPVRRPAPAIDECIRSAGCGCPAWPPTPGSGSAACRHGECRMA